VVVSGKISNWFIVLSILELLASSHKCKDTVRVFMIGIDTYTYLLIFGFNITVSHGLSSKVSPSA